MSQSFVNALKSKATRIQAERKEREDEPVAGKMYALTGNDGNCIAAGKSWTESEVKDMPVVPPLETEEPIIAEVPETGEYSRFKQQVNELLAEMDIDAADLMLLAVDCLHKATFGVN